MLLQVFSYCYHSLPLSLLSFYFTTFRYNDKLPFTLTVKDYLTLVVEYLTSLALFTRPYRNSIQELTKYIQQSAST